MKLTGGAYLISGGSDAVPRLFAFLEKEGINTTANPDIYVREYSHFGIDEARELRGRASSRAIAGDRRIFIVVCPGLNSEAQNALLKTFEEPSADAIFFFIVPSPDMLLPTLRSRTQRISLPGAVSQGQVDADEFIAAAPAKRIEMLKPLLDRDENDERDIGAVIGFLASLESAAGGSLPKGGEGLKAIYRARKYITDKGALLKPLLEQVALLVPRRIG